MEKLDKKSREGLRKVAQKEREVEERVASFWEVLSELRVEFEQRLVYAHLVEVEQTR